MKEYKDFYLYNEIVQEIQNLFEHEKMTLKIWLEPKPLLARAKTLFGSSQCPNWLLIVNTRALSSS